MRHCNDMVLQHKIYTDLVLWTECSDETKIKGKGKGKEKTGVVSWKPPVYPAHLRRYNIQSLVTCSVNEVKATMSVDCC